MQTYGIEDKRGYDEESSENTHRKSRARQKNKKIINQDYNEYWENNTNVGKKHNKSGN